MDSLLIIDGLLPFLAAAGVWLVESARRFGRCVFTRDRDEDKRWRLIAKRPFLQEMIDSWHPDLDALLRRRLISLDELESLLFLSREDRCLRLLTKVLPQRGAASIYDKFVRVLEDTGEVEAARVLRRSSEIADSSLVPRPFVDVGPHRQKVWGRDYADSRCLKTTKQVSH